MRQWQFTVANQTLRLDCEKSGEGTLVRLDDGLEARFNTRECLPHLIEGVVGRRTYQTHHERITAELAKVPSCA